MTDDEQLMLLAAQAAGYEVEQDTFGAFHIHIGSGPTSWVPWNPLQSDGDALRLAEATNVTWRKSITIQQVYAINEITGGIYTQQITGSALDAIRRAIVIAASDGIEP